MEDNNSLLNIFTQLKNIANKLDDITNGISKIEEFNLNDHSVGKVAGTGNIGIQNVNTLFSIKPVELSSGHKQIKIFKHSYSDWVDILEYFAISFFGIGLIFYIFVFPDNLKNFIQISDISLNWKEHLRNIIAFSLLSFITLIITSLFDKYRNKMYLEVSNNTITIGQQDREKCYIVNKFLKRLKFEDIRSIYKRKSLFGYTFYIYEVTTIEPYLRFNTESVHVANTIHELITYKIQEHSKLVK